MIAFKLYHHYETNQSLRKRKNILSAETIRFLKAKNYKFLNEKATEASYRFYFLININLLLSHINKKLSGVFFFCPQSIGVLKLKSEKTHYGLRPSHDWSFSYSDIIRSHL